MKLYFFSPSVGLGFQISVAPVRRINIHGKIMINAHDSILTDICSLDLLRCCQSQASGLFQKPENQGCSGSCKGESPDAGKELNGQKQNAASMGQSALCGGDAHSQKAQNPGNAKDRTESCRIIHLHVLIHIFNHQYRKETCQHTHAFFSYITCQI